MPSGNLVCRRAIETLDCPGQFSLPVGDTDPSCGRFILASPAAVSEDSSEAVPYASLIVPPSGTTSLQFVNFPEKTKWSGEGQMPLQVLHHSPSRRTFIFGGVNPMKEIREEGRLMYYRHEL